MKITAHRHLHRALAGVAAAATIAVTAATAPSAIADPTPPTPTLRGGMSPNSLGTPMPLSASNEKIAFDYFVAHGLTTRQAAGVIGNLDQESGVSPTAKEYNGGPGRGIAQWGIGGRWDHDAGDNVGWYAAQRGSSSWSLNLQLDFAWFELTHFSKYGLADLKRATTIAAAVDVFQDRFEVCGDCQLGKRLVYAQAAYDKYAGSAPVVRAVPRVATTANGKRLFFRDSHGRVVTDWISTSDGTWHGPSAIGGTTNGNLTASPDGTRVVFPDPTGHLVTTWYANGDWHGPARIGGTGHDPVIAKTGKQLRVYYLQPDGHLAMDWISARDHTWHGPKKLPGTATGTLAVSPDGLRLIYTGKTSGNIVTDWYGHDQQWHGPATISRTGTNPTTATATVPGGHELRVFYASAGTLKYDWLSATDGHWHGPTTIPGNPTGRLSASADGTRVFYTDTHGRIASTWTTNHTWHTGTQTGGTGHDPVVAPTPKVSRVYFTTTTGTIAEDRYDRTDNHWHGPTTPGGTTGN